MRLATRMGDGQHSLFASFVRFSDVPGLGRSRAFLHAAKRLYRLKGPRDDEEGPGVGGEGESTVTGMEEDMTTEDADLLALAVLSKNSACQAAYALHLETSHALRPDATAAPKRWARFPFSTRGVGRRANLGPTYEGRESKKSSKVYEEVDRA